MVLQCKKCGDVIVSKHRHDMVWCKCGAIAIDGGSDYTKITGNKEDIEVLMKQSDYIDAIQSYEYEQSELNKEIYRLNNREKLLEKALSLAREYMLKGMCADDVPSEEWLLKQAKEMIKSE